MNNPFLDRIPKPQRSRLKPSLAVAGFRAEIAAKDSLMMSLFDIIPVAKGKAEALSRALTPMLDTMEGTDKLFGEKAFKDQIFEMGADRALYTDSGAAITLVADAIDRLQRRSNLSLFDRGVETYVPGVHIAQAISSLANQYKHLGEWPQSQGATSKDREIVKALVGDPERLDAAAEFLKRGFTTMRLKMRLSPLRMTS